MAIPESHFVGQLTLIKEELIALDNLKTFFFTLASLADGKREAGPPEGDGIVIPTSMLRDFGFKLSTLVDEILYNLDPQIQEKLAAAQGGGE